MNDNNQNSTNKRQRVSKLCRSLSLADDRYVAEATPDALKPRRIIKMSRMILAACLCVLLVAGGLVLFLPYDNTPPSVDKYENSEYYEVIKAFQAVTVVKTESHYNLFDKLFSGLFDLKEMDGATNAAPGAPMEDHYGGENLENTSKDDPTSDAGGYEEVTDNQVKGVIEADRIKRTKTHIFYLDGKKLKAYSINGEGSALVGEYEFPQNLYFAKWEFYLSQDGKTATVIIPYSNGNFDTNVKIYSLDVSDPANIKGNKIVTVTGSYLSSRLINGELLLITRFSVKSNPNFDKEEQFIPQIDNGNGKESIPADSIYMPDKVTSPRYTVVVKLDEQTLDVEGSSAFLSYTENVYVSSENVYVTYQYTDKKTEGEFDVRKIITDVTRIYYKDGALEHKGTVSVEGYVKDQYSFDEKDGILRVVTTVDNDYSRRYNNGSDMSWEVSGMTGTSASLWCIDIATGKTVASVERFAPIGETVRSVRFDGNYAYVCTAIQQTDPVFFFDLSDLSNIVYKDTGTITGFSTSLINLGDGFLLGVGVGSSTMELKIEIYAEGEKGVESYCTYKQNMTYYSTDYKSYYVDRENGLLGLGISNANTGVTEYIVLLFDGVELQEIAREKLAGNPTLMRGVYVDGYYYMLGDSDFKAVRLSDDK